MPGAPITIRTATAADAAAILDIYRPFVEGSSVSFEEAVPTVDEMAQRILVTVEQHPYFVAVDGADVVGYAYATPYRMRTAYQWGCEVSVYVAAAHHRRGIAHALYTRLIDTLLAQGYVNLYAGITLPNEASVAFHESMGFERFAVYEGVGFKLGEWRDVGWWVLRRDDPPSDPRPPTPFRILE